MKASKDQLDKVLMDFLDKDGRLIDANYLANELIEIISADDYLYEHATYSHGYYNETALIGFSWMTNDLLSREYGAGVEVTVKSLEGWIAFHGGDGGAFKIFSAAVKDIMEYRNSPSSFDEVSDDDC